MVFCSIFDDFIFGISDIGFQANDFLDFGFGKSNAFNKVSILDDIIIITADGVWNV